MAAIPKDGAQVIERPRVVRSDPERMTIRFDRFVELALTLQRESQVVPS